MLVKELIEILQKEDQELPVVLVTDHGQTPMSLSGHGKGLVEDIDEYMMEETSRHGDEVFFLEAF